MNAIKEIRLYLNYDQKHFARVLGLSPSAISRLEDGQVKPSFKTIRKIRDIIKVSGTKLYSVDRLLEEL